MMLSQRVRLQAGSNERGSGMTFLLSRLGGYAIIAAASATWFCVCLTDSRHEVLAANLVPRPTAAATFLSDNYYIPFSDVKNTGLMKSTFTTGSFGLEHLAAAAALAANSNDRKSTVVLLAQKGLDIYETAHIDVDGKITSLKFVNQQLLIRYNSGEFKVGLKKIIGNGFLLEYTKMPSARQITSVANSPAATPSQNTANYAYRAAKAGSENPPDSDHVVGGSISGSIYYPKQLVITQCYLETSVEGRALHYRLRNDSDTGYRAIVRFSGHRYANDSPAAYQSFRSFQNFVMPAHTESPAQEIMMPEFVQPPVKDVSCILSDVAPM